LLILKRPDNLSAAIAVPFCIEASTLRSGIDLDPFRQNKATARRLPLIRDIVRPPKYWAERRIWVVCCPSKLYDLNVRFRAYSSRSTKPVSIAISERPLSSIAALTAEKPNDRSQAAG